MICGHAARFARVEREVRAEDFLEGDFFGGGMQMHNANARIHKYIVECLSRPPIRAQVVHPSPFLRNIVNGGGGSPKFRSIIRSWVRRLLLLILK